MKAHRTAVSLMLLVAACFGALAAGESEADLKTLNHLQQIGQACLIYAAENRGYLPTTFAQIEPELRQPEAFLDARNDTKPPADWEKLSPEQRADWANKNAEFDFTSVAGQKSFRIKHPFDVPLATTRDKPGRKKVTLFADGRAQIEGSGVDPASLPPPPATKP